MNESGGKRSLSYELEELVTITSHKKQRLQSLLNMTKMQSKAIEQGDAGLLADYLQEKQRHIDAIDQLDTEFIGIYNDDIKTGLLGKNSCRAGSRIEGLYLQLRTLISCVQELLQEVCDLEESNNIKIKEAMEKLKGKLHHIQVGRKGYNAYTNPNNITDGIYIDKKN